VFGDFPAAIGANHKPPRICMNGYISIGPVRFDLTGYEYIDALRELY